MLPPRPADRPEPKHDALRTACDACGAHGRDFGTCLVCGKGRLWFVPNSRK